MSKFEFENSAPLKIMNGPFPTYISDLKQNALYVQDVYQSGQKFYSTLKQTSNSHAIFLESFKKMINHSARMQVGDWDSKDNIQIILSKLITQQLTLQQKYANLSNMLLECIIQPLGSKCTDEWKRNVTIIEKEHSKEFKKVSTEIKKMQSDTIKLQKKVHKKTADSKGSLPANNSEAAALQVALQDISQKFSMLERTSRQAMNSCHREQASRLLSIINACSPLLETQISTSVEISNIKNLTNDLAAHKEFLSGLVSGSLRPEIHNTVVPTEIKQENDTVMPTIKNQRLNNSKTPTNFENVTTQNRFRQSSQSSSQASSSSNSRKTNNSSTFEDQKNSVSLFERFWIFII